MKKFILLFSGLSLMVLSCTEAPRKDISVYTLPNDETVASSEINPFDRDFDVSKLPGTPENELIKYGYELVSNSAKYIGPDSDNPFAGNHLACKNCHLNSGTKPYSAPYIGVTKRFPTYRSREGHIGTIEDRINGCMQRSMAGKSLPVNSKELKAIVAYMEWLSKDVSKDTKIEGKGLAKINFPDRAVDLKHGEEVFKQHCVACHQADGQGMKNPDGTYTYPPLWGNDSYNNGAGMHRVLTAAYFIKSNMPLGATYENPVLTDEEAYDVAGYINSFNRPKKKNLEKDFPGDDLKKKPVSCPYPPYADNFSQKQHQFGPFQPIIEFYEKEYGKAKIK